MSGRILVLGAAGRLGRAAAEAFRDAGWTVKSLVRARSVARVAPDTQIVEADALDRETVIEAAQGCDVVLHALNTPYTGWARFALPLAGSAIAAAGQANATLLFPGNLYNYGLPLPQEIDETTPMHPTSRKGHMRLAIEARLRQEAERGLKTIVLRAGDFYGGAGTGSWFDRIIVRDLGQGRVTYPGPLEFVHAWAYLPDFAATCVRLAEARAALAGFETFGFAGDAVTGREFVRAIARATGREVTVSRMPWWLLHTLGPVVPIFGELSDIAYLWQMSHRISGERLEATLGEVPRTPFETAVAAALRALGHRTII
ncbi:MAG TPA: NAD-dependent epimerase/dehydratase family protein [Xanthobacteraceae bacterium]|nr:NAD-dependent epimerase/dehydratase family protein [Xanthobacteraceae bacterium]